MGKIGLAFVNPAPLTKPAYVINFAKKCEAMAIHSLWIIDRVAYDNLEPLTVLAAAAGATEKIRLGTSVLLPALRHPTLLAKTVATLDFVSNGRVVLGVGFGSRENDFSAVEVRDWVVPQRIVSSMSTPLCGSGGAALRPGLGQAALLPTDQAR